jgi:2-keto-3-deoxy-L-rhamnonate aldolase RhmA
MTKKTLLAAWQQLPSLQSTVAMASMGFDWLVVDLEHTSITTQEAEAIFIAATRYKCTPYVRMPSADPYLARRMLDAGAQGIIVPVVEYREAFDEFAAHCHFPPQGKRGVGLVNANLWGEILTDYMTNFQPPIIAQIETKKGAENIEKLFKSEFLSGIMVGPYDLSASLGKPGQFDDPEFLDLVKHIVNTAKAHKKFIGYHQVEPNLVELKKRQTEGYDFIAYGTDIIAMRHALKGIKS